MLSALKLTCTCHRGERGRRTPLPRRVGPRWLLLAFALVALGTEAAAATADARAPETEGRVTLGEGIRGPDITIIERDEQTVFEFRQNGQLRMVRVVPKWGKPYYLVPRDPTSGFGDLERADMLLPSWVIAEF